MIPGQPSVNPNALAPLDVRQRSLFPSDFRVTLNLPPCRELDDVTREKEENRLALLDLARNFEGNSARMVEAATEVAMLAHFNQFRGGAGAPHYSSHLLQVAKRSVALAKVSGLEFPPIHDAAGNIIAHEALLIAVAILHDTVEDFPLNACGLGEESADKARHAIRHRILEVMGEAGSTAAHRILDEVERLSNENPDEFPDAAYREKVAGSPYSIVVKLADMGHNLETGPDFDPAYYLVSAPYLMNRLPIDEATRRGLDMRLVACLDKLDLARAPSEIRDL